MTTAAGAFLSTTQTMKLHNNPHRLWPVLLMLTFGWVMSAVSAYAQSTGTIQGRVFNPATQEYVRNAEVRLEGTNRVEVTGSDGSFQFNNVERPKKYDDFFPMISAKYNFSRNLQFQAGFNKAISRPPIDSLTGAWLINEDAQRITSPNPNLLPEYSKNYAARLAYYFEPAGQLSIGVSQNNIRNLRETRLGSAEEFGYGDDPEYSSYEFNAPFNVSSPRRFRSMELAYSQTLPFTHEALRGITVNSSYTRTYVS